MGEPVLGAKQIFKPGEPNVIDSVSHQPPLAVVFEDDGQTGYFYALDLSNDENMILDALHIYDVAIVTDKDRPSEAKIVWSTSGDKVALLINEYPHAVFDFSAERGYCRTGFPPSAPTWSQEGHEWDDSVLKFFSD
ncbi:MAG: DUF2251 domain-containing protein [Pseudomonadota bacterium]